MTFISLRGPGPDHALYLLRYFDNQDLSLDPNVRPDGYPGDWDNIAHFIKHLASWRCEHCGFRNRHHPSVQIGVHHLNNDKLTSTYTNLIALCRKCHLYMHNVPFDFSTGWIHTDFIPLWVRKRGLAAQSSRPAPFRDSSKIPKMAPHHESARSE